MSLPLAKKSLGQHWLTDEPTLVAMCDGAGVNSNDTVLEVGPGTGTLTAKLLSCGAHVVAVEVDEKLADDLVHIFNDSLQYLTIFKGSILEFDLTTLPVGYKVVANIPYYLTSNLLRTLCESVNPPSQIALLVQKEVAERVVAKPGDMSLLSVSVQFYCESSLGPVVQAKLFTPPPKVDSQILKLNYRSQPPFPDVDTKKFFRLVKAGFASRRKTLLNSLSGGLRQEKTETSLLLQLAGIDPGIRPQELSLNDWYALYRAWQKSAVPSPFNT